MLLVIACLFYAVLEVITFLLGFRHGELSASTYVLVTELDGSNHRAAITALAYMRFACGRDTDHVSGYSLVREGRSHEGGGEGGACPPPEWKNKVKFYSKIRK